MRFKAPRDTLVKRKRFPPVTLNVTHFRGVEVHRVTVLLVSNSYLQARVCKDPFLSVDDEMDIHADTG